MLIVSLFAAVAVTYILFFVVGDFIVQELLYFLVVQLELLRKLLQHLHTLFLSLLTLQVLLLTELELFLYSNKLVNSLLFLSNQLYLLCL